MVFALIMGAWLLGCASKIDAPAGLVNQGVLPLSDKDPYLGANIFLSREMEQSSFLHSFIKGEGSPAAIELRQPRFGDFEVIFFYPESNRVFIGVPEQVSKINRQWIIRGPYSIDRRDYRNLDQIQKSVKGEPVYMLFGRKYSFNRYRDEEQRAPLKPVVLPTPKPTPPRRVAPKPAKPAGTPEPKIFTDLSSDQLAILMSKGYAERNRTGDIIHSVQTADESFARIAKWYTDSSDNAAALAAANGMGADAKLDSGMRLKIPIELIKRSKVMPPDFK